MIWIATGSFIAGALLSALWAIWLRRRQPEMSRPPLAEVLHGLFGEPVAVLSLFGGLVAAAAVDLNGRS